MNEELVVYNYHDTLKIHEFVFSESSRNSIDKFIQLIYAIYDDYLKGETGVRIILDLSCSGMLPVRTLSEAMKHGFQQLPSFPNPYICLLTKDPFGETLTRAVMVSQYNSLQHFKPDDRDRAIEWLLTTNI